MVPALVTPATPPESWAEVRPLLRPVLRPSTYALDDGGSRIRRPLFPFVDELLAIDYPDVIGFPDETKLAEWGVTAEEALTVARENLAALVPVAELPGDGIVKIAVDEADYLSSWILVPDWLLVSTTNFEYPPVAFVPDQRSLLIVPGHPELLSEAFEAVEQEYREAARPLSPQGYTLDESGLVIPLDRMTTANDAEVARARAVLAGAEYHAQQQWLEEHYRDELEVIYVSSLMVAEREDGIHTVTVWGEGVDAALPVADFLAFATDDERTIMVPFDTAVDLTASAPADGPIPRCSNVSRRPRSRSDSSETRAVAAGSVRRHPLTHSGVRNGSRSSIPCRLSSAVDPARSLPAWELSRCRYAASRTRSARRWSPYAPAAGAPPR
jgi:hypothetical protein